jgi:hypothetical protein
MLAIVLVGYPGPTVVNFGARRAKLSGMLEALSDKQ